MALMFTLLMKEHPSINEFHNKFLLPGHTHMKCDTDLSTIDKKIKKSDIVIAHPHDWAFLVGFASNRIAVVEMEQ